MKLTTILTALLLLVLAGYGTPVFAQENDWRVMIQNPQAYNFYDIQAAYERDLGGQPYQKGLGMKQYKRWEYYWESRVDEQGNFPPAGAVLEEVNAYYNNRSQQKSAFSSSGNWTQLGPIAAPANGTSQLNGNGRLNCVAFHPTNANIIYVGAPSGGFWKTTNGGSSWTKHVTGMVRLGVSSIVVHPTNPNIIYIGTGDRDGSDVAGYGVWRSIDGGLTWSARNSGMGNLTVNEIIMDPNNSNILLAACSNSRVYRSTNGGASWTSSSSLSSNPKDIAMHPTNSSIVYAAGTRLHRSTDGGATWTQITSGLPSSPQRMALAVSADKPSWVYVLAGNSSGLIGIYRSTNSGINFYTRTTTPNILGYSITGNDTRGQAWYDLVIAADPTNANVIYTGGVNLWKSTDAGSTMTSISYWVGPSSGRDGVHADQHALEFSPHNNKLYNGNDGGLYVSDDNGSTWDDLSSGLAIAQVYKIGVSQKTTDRVINGYQDNGTAISNGTFFKTEIGGDGMECIIDPTTDQYMYGALYYGDIRRSTNTGSSFSSIANSISEQGAWVTPYTLDPNNANRMFAGFDNVWRNNSVRSSSSWTKISSFSSTSNIRDIVVAPSNSNVVYVSKYDNSFRVSTNALSSSPTWTNRASSLPVSNEPLDIAVDPNNWQHVYIALNNNIYESFNAGQSWTDISGTLPNISLNTIVIDENSSNGAMYVGMDVGVYYKDNSLSDWVPYSTALPNIEVTELEIQYIGSNGTLYAATYGQGLWKSSLNNTSSCGGSVGSLTQNFESQSNCSTSANCASTNCSITGAWSNVTNGAGDDIDWRIDQGGTPSSGTGPSVDYNPGTSTGKYAYIEASSSCYSKVAHLVSDCITLNGSYSFVLRYHANGSSMGSLHVDINSNGTWTNNITSAITGSHGDSWKTRVVNLSAYNGQSVQLRIRGYTGTYWKSDIAIDDLYLYSNSSNLPPVDNQPIPLADHQVAAKCMGNGSNTVSWVAFDGEQAGTYEVQKQIKGDWKTVATLPAEAGRSHYEWEDQAPYLGENLYKIIKVDLTQVERSEPKLAATHCGVDMGTFVVYPNPFREEVTLQFESPMTAELPYQITNTLGQVIRQGTFQAQAGENSFVLPMEGLAQGMYLLHTQDNMVKLIKQ